MSDGPSTNLPQEHSQSTRCSSSGAALPFFLSVLVLFAIAYGGWTWWRVRQFDIDRAEGVLVSKIGPPITDFELTERSGEPFRSADMKGKVWVATYFFTSCPGNCIRLNQRLQYLNSIPDLNDVTWVSITCDPDNDHLEALRKYADHWQADPERWLFVRGPLEYTQQIAKGMSMFLERKGHQDYAIVFDKAGKIRGRFDATSLSQCEKMHELLQELEAEAAPQAVASSAAAKSSS